MRMQQEGGYLLRRQAEVGGYGADAAGGKICRSRRTSKIWRKEDIMKTRRSRRKEGFTEEVHVGHQE